MQLNRLIPRRYPRFFLVALTAFVALYGSRAGEPSKPTLFLERSQSSAFTLRVMSWNVGLGSIFPPDGVRHESFARIVKAVNPDLVCLQEIGPRQPIHELTGMMDRLLPLKDGLHWQSHRATNTDNVVLSRYPLSHDGGTTILLVEQNARLALRVSSRGYVLQTGSIVLSDSAENLWKNEMVRKAYLGEM